MGKAEGGKRSFVWLLLMPCSSVALGIPPPRVRGRSLHGSTLSPLRGRVPQAGRDTERINKCVFVGANRNTNHGHRWTPLFTFSPQISSFCILIYRDWWPISPG